MDLEIFSQNTSDNYDNLVKSSKTTNSCIDLLQNENKSLIVELTDVRSDHNKLQENYNNLKEDFLELKCRSMQEILLCFGIPEVRQQNLQDTQQLQDPTLKPKRWTVPKITLTKINVKISGKIPKIPYEILWKQYYLLIPLVV